MKMLLKRFIKKFFVCKHEHALLAANEGYCPECGEYLKKNYYVVRCSCCGIKRRAKYEFEKILPLEKFCTNCGEQKYIIEKYESLSFVDISYAIEIKETVRKVKENPDIEIWVEKEDKNNKNNIPRRIPLIGSQLRYLELK